jgi:hypothetical protein
MPTSHRGSATSCIPADGTEAPFGVALPATALGLVLGTPAVLADPAVPTEGLLAAPPVPAPVLLPPAPPPITAPLVSHAPVRVDMTPMLCSAEGAEPQFSACAIQTTLLSRSNVTFQRCG